MESTDRIVSVAEMARMVGLSRSRFYQLIGSTFPFPIYDVGTHRPFFNEELQQVCLDVRRRNVGINGKPIFFHCNGGNAPMPKRKAKTTKPNQYVDLIEGLEALGLAATTDQVAVSMRFLYPNGAGVATDNDVLRAVFLHLKRQITGDNHGK
jgi:hypothetical protein